MNTLESKVYELLSKKLVNLGYELVNVHYQKENGENYLKIIVDKDEDISLDDIVKLSDLISPLLDVSDIISDKYILDISSLGAEKEIKPAKLDKYVNKYISLHLSHPYKGLNYLEGDLLSVTKDQVIIEIRDKARKIKVNLERNYIDKARLAIKF